jgi:hypothetical protein
MTSTRSLLIFLDVHIYHEVYDTNFLPYSTSRDEAINHTPLRQILLRDLPLLWTIGIIFHDTT